MDKVRSKINSGNNCNLLWHNIANFSCLNIRTSLSDMAAISFSIDLSQNASPALKRRTIYKCCRHIKISSLSKAIECTDKYYELAILNEKKWVRTMVIIFITEKCIRNSHSRTHIYMSCPLPTPIVKLSIKWHFHYLFPIAQLKFQMDKKHQSHESV